MRIVHGSPRKVERANCHCELCMIAAGITNRRREHTRSGTWAKPKPIRNDHKWTDEERAVVAANPELSHSELAKKLDRKAAAVKAERWRQRRNDSAISAMA